MPASPRATDHAPPERRARIPSKSAGSDSAAPALARSSSDRPGSASGRIGRPRLLGAGRRRLDPSAPARDPRERRIQIAQQHLERTCQDRRPRYDDVVISRPRRAGKDRAHRSPKTATGAVAGNRGANAPAGGEANANLLRLAPRPGLQDERRCDPTPAGTRHGDEFATPFQADHPSSLSAAFVQTGPVRAARLSRTDACVPWRAFAR